MHGIKVAGAIVGGSVLITFFVAGSIFGLTMWLGWVGGAIGFVFWVLVMFAVMAWAINKG